MRWLAKSTACLAGLLLMLCCAAATAGAAELGANVPGHPGLTYFDLMKLVVTDLARDAKGDASGSKLVALNHIDTTQEKPEVPETVTLQSFETLPIPDDPSRIVLLADLGRAEGQVSNIQALALFSLSSTPKLLDAVGVGTDRFTYLPQGAPSMLAPKTPLILINNSHWNSNQNYLSIEIIFIRDDHFRLIDSLFTLSDHGCAFARTQEPSITTAAAPGRYRAISIMVTDRRVATGQDCGDEAEKKLRPHVATYKAVYHWDEPQQNFVTQSKALEELQKINKKRL